MGLKGLLISIILFIFLFLLCGAFVFACLGTCLVCFKSLQYTLKENNREQPIGVSLVRSLRFNFSESIGNYPSLIKTSIAITALIVVVTVTGN